MDKSCDQSHDSLPSMEEELLIGQKEQMPAVEVTGNVALQANQDSKVPSSVPLSNSNVVLDRESGETLAEFKKPIENMAEDNPLPRQRTDYPETNPSKAEEREVNQGSISPWQQTVSPPKREVASDTQNPDAVGQTQSQQHAEKRRRNRLQGSGALSGLRKPGTRPQRSLPAAVNTSQKAADMSRDPSTEPGSLENPGLPGQPSSLSFVFEEVTVEAPIKETVHLLEEHGKHILSRTNAGESWVMFVPNFLQEDESDVSFKRLIKELNWQQRENTTGDGEMYTEPRMSLWFGEFPYTYSRVSWNLNKEWNEQVASLKEKIEINFDHKYNSVLCNLYRDGHDSIAWHSDDEYGLGKEPNIASLSLGDTRYFEMMTKKHALEEKEKYLPLGSKLKIPLSHGSLLIMGGATQHDWLHRVPKEYHDKGIRVNLTYRWIIPDNRDHVAK
ncbi:putative alpha-ketoglutarate-dependent dioxygenase alkB-like 3 isoform X4 [Apostichopus japonicus]|uniref:Putative alpha-ketoglutarate-dependent dioxygenase alkB-like 3 isoform X4 n=1 Tax=Stichopus japonicus TaxID=307972 RepID=A0A2G8JJL0_STIJA|nr:putative alpha-ketoglutarate-dependent dioxygenase alkB-like 3 isoform X4 [Apostichopus japonicus]